MNGDRGQPSGSVEAITLPVSGHGWRGPDDLKIRRPILAWVGVNDRVVIRHRHSMPDVDPQLCRRESSLDSSLRPGEIHLTLSVWGYSYPGHRRRTMASQS